MRTGLIKLVHDGILSIGVAWGASLLRQLCLQLLCPADQAAVAQDSPTAGSCAVLRLLPCAARCPLLLGRKAGAPAWSLLMCDSFRTRSELWPAGPGGEGCWVCCAGPFVLEKLLQHLRSPSRSVGSCAPPLSLP